MVRICGIDLDESKQVKDALTGIYGIGKSTSLFILQKAKIDPTKRMGLLDDVELSRIREVIDNSYKVEDDLRRSIKQNLIRLGQINSVRGRRHRQNLPVRGQRTRTNSRTRRNTRLF